MGDSTSEPKLVLGINTSLKMGKGKVAAQCAHAAVGAYKQVAQLSPELLDAWEDAGQPKITLKVTDDKAMQQLYRAARDMGLPVSIVRDAGRTQIAAGSKTVIAIGPAPRDLIDQVTGKLSLY